MGSAVSFLPLVVGVWALLKFTICFGSASLFTKLTRQNYVYFADFTKPNGNAN